MNQTNKGAVLIAGSILALALCYVAFVIKPAFAKNTMAEDVTSKLKRQGFDVTDEGSLRLESSKREYKKGEAIELNITSSTDCRLTLLNIDSTGDSCLLYPHHSLKNRVLKAGHSVKFPLKGRFFLNKVGTERFIAFCNTKAEVVGEMQVQTRPVDCSKKIGEKKHNQRVYETVTFDINARKGDTKVKPKVFQNSLSVTVTP